MTMLPPGSTIGILGGGQLGRMLASAAADLGYHTHILAPDAESVAAQRELEALESRGREGRQRIGFAVDV